MWKYLKTAILAAATAAYSAGYITEKAFTQIKNALGNSAAMKGKNR